MQCNRHSSRGQSRGRWVRATILVDGFVRGAWSVAMKGCEAALTIEPFAPLSGTERDALAEEGGRLVRFVEPDASTVGVRFAEA